MMELPISSGQFMNLTGMDVVDSMAAIHPSQLSIGQQQSAATSQLSAMSPSNNNVVTMDSLSINTGLGGMASMHYGVNNQNNMISSHISSLMSDQCINFTGAENTF